MDQIKSVVTNKRIHYVLLGLTVLLFVGTRLFRLDSVPFTAWGMELDELGAAYDAWCIQGWGVDRYLTKMPLMFLNTGDGQNALYIYMAALMFKIFGFSLVKFRLIAVICATAAFVCLYHLSKMIYGNEIYSIVPITLMTVMPVFIMSEHWGLESYLFLSFSIISFFFLVKAVDSGKIIYYLADGILWGLTFYTYGISYVVVPAFLILTMIYLIYLKKINWKMTVAEMIPIILLGIPLFIEQLVIAGIIPPFSLKYMDFFPMERARWGEISFEYVLNNIRNAPMLLFVRDDMWDIDCPNNVFGTVYYVSIPFMAGGAVISVIKLIKSLRKREYDICAHIFVFYFVAQITAFMTFSLRVVSANEIYFPFLMFTAIGIVAFVKRMNKKSIIAVIAGIYAVYFLTFAIWMYSGREFGWSYITRPQPQYPIYVDIRAARAASEIREKYGDKPIQMIINDGGAHWYESICLFMGTSPYDYNTEGTSENGYAIGVPTELDLSGDTAYLIQDELHHITDYLVSEGFNNEVVSVGGYSMVTK